MNGWNALEPLLLGLSTGTWCVMYCAPITLPFLFGREDASVKKNAGLVNLFLGAVWLPMPSSGSRSGAWAAGGGCLRPGGSEEAFALGLYRDRIALLLESVVPGATRACGASSCGKKIGMSLP
jgi:hypothetical protein